MTTESSPLYDNPNPADADDSLPSDEQTIRVGAMGTVFPPAESEAPVVEPAAGTQAEPSATEPTVAEDDLPLGPPELEVPRLHLPSPEIPAGEPLEAVATLAARAEPSSADIEAAVEEEFRAPETIEEAPAEIEVLAEQRARAQEMVEREEPEEVGRATEAEGMVEPPRTTEPFPVEPPPVAGQVPPPPQPQPAPPAPEPGRESALPGCLRDILVMGVALLLGASMALLVLYVINGALDFAQHPRFKLLESDVASLRQDVRALGEQMSQTQDDIAQLDARLSDVTARTDAIETRLDAIDTQLAAMQADIDGLNEGVAGLDERANALAEQLDSVSAQLVAVDQALAELGGRLDQAEAGMGRLDERLGLAEEDISAARERVQAVVERSQELQGVVEEMSAQLSEVEDAAARFRRFVSGLEALLNSMSEPEAPDASMSLTPTPPELSGPSGVLTETVSSPAGAVQPEGEAAASQPPRERFDGTPALRLFPPQSPLYRPAPGLSHIFGLVWEDANGNGIPDEGERPLPEAAVTLHDARGKELAVVVTGEDGRYLFADLAPGLYIVVESDPEGLESVTPNAVTVSAREDGLVEVNFADR